jgi:hypothetical protein
MSQGESAPETVSPWANEAIAPLQAAAALVPLVPTDHGLILDKELHGTAFFITDDGWFLTAAHVVQDLPADAPPLVAIIFGGPGYVPLCVRKLVLHPGGVDVAIGRVDVNPICRPSPMTLSTKRLKTGDAVSVLGYPRTKTTYTTGDNGETLSRLTVTPDYFGGEVLDHHPHGVTLARGSAYTTDIRPPTGHVQDLSGASGGPLVANDTVHVHGLLCSSSEHYSVCTDITEVLDWEVFSDAAGPFSVREAGRRFPQGLRIL